jgi:FtsP/CotA-like multicopper oxidase with cupredoxin domain
VPLGAVEEWTIRNTHEHDDHMFHIHTNPFQVIEVSGQPQADRPWRDTAVVPRPAIALNRYAIASGPVGSRQHYPQGRDRG